MHPVELLKLTGLPHLRELYLPGPVWNPGGGREDHKGVFAALAKNPSVERVAFAWTYSDRMDVGDAEIKDLFPWTGLTDLRCAQCKLSRLNLAPFVKLRNLDLSYNLFTDEGMEGLAGLKELRRLFLRESLVTDEGLRHLQNVTSLEELDLSGARVGDKGIENLRGLRNLRRLNILGARATDVSMDTLAALSNLEVLNLYRTQITNSGLAKLQGLKNLTDLDVRYTLVTPNGIEALRGALPGVRVRFVGSAAPQTKGPGADRPADTSDEAIASWIKALGGAARLSAGHITSVSLADRVASRTHNSPTSRPFTTSGSSTSRSPRSPTPGSTLSPASPA